MLHLRGIDRERFTFRYRGRDFRPTDVSGKVVKEIVAQASRAWRERLLPCGLNSDYKSGEA